MTATQHDPTSVGSAPLRHDATDKVVGAARYPADAVPPDALHAVVVFTNRPHARIVALDTSAAENSPGVVAVLTAADVPVNEYGLTLFDQPVFVGPVDTGRAAVDGAISRWEADQVALVVADTEAAARLGSAAIRAEWEDLPRVDDIDQALADDATMLHPENGLATNAYHHLNIRKGEMERGWSDADVVIEATYEVPYQEHAFLQTESGTAYLDDEGRITVECTGQWTYEDREQIAHALDISDEEVRVIYRTIGGAFGGKEDMSVQIVLALAVKVLAERGEHRPVHCRWSREESIVGHHKRHRGRIKARLGATSDGMITALEADVTLEAGGYNYTSNKVLGNAHLSVAGPYRVPNAKIHSQAVYTTNVPGGAFRGFGGPQGAFAMECQLNKLADALDIDPAEIRRRNALHDGDVGITQTVLPVGVTTTEVIDACVERSGWDRPLREAAPFNPIVSLPSDPTSVVTGRGFAAGYKNVGFSFGAPERCDAEIHLHGDGDFPERADLFHGGSDVGQGAHLAFRQIAADAVGLPLELVTGHFSDTSTSGDSGSASASRLTFMAGNSILGAAEEADKAWRDGQRPAIGKFRYIPPPTEALDADTGAGAPNFSYGYMATEAEVSVDLGTGQIRVDRIVSTHDVGKAINPSLVRGQIEGAVVQAHGYTLSENLQIEAGHITTPRLSSYLIPGIGDVPEVVDSVILELADPLGPYGARGMAEMPYITYAPAVIAAVHDATGIWFDAFPLTPSRVLAALSRRPDQSR